MSMWVTMREKESVENVFSSFFYLLQYVFYKERSERRCVCGSGDGKELEKCRESFFSFFFIWQNTYLYSHIPISMQS